MVLFPLLTPLLYPKMANLKFFTLCVLFTITLVIEPVCPKDQYVEPLLFGMKVSIPYDMANLFTRFPFQGGLSVVLGLGLAGILFFGVITAPFGYMFGVPSEKYVLGDYSFHKGGRMLTYLNEEFSSPASSSVLLEYIRSEKANPRTIFSDQRQLQDSQDEEQCCQTFLYYFDSVMNYLDYWEPGFLQKWKPSLNVLRRRLGGKVGKDIVTAVESSLSTKFTPEYESSMFYLISEKETDVRNEVCQQRMVCHAHGTLQYLPETALKIYHKFSKKITKIPSTYVEAMRIGMTNEALCSEVYSACRDNAFTLALKSYMSLLPDKTQLNGMPRRKQKMYNQMNFLK